MPLYLNVRAFLPPSSVTNPYSTIVHTASGHGYCRREAVVRPCPRQQDGAAQGGSRKMREVACMYSNSQFLLESAKCKACATQRASYAWPPFPGKWLASSSMSCRRFTGFPMNPVMPHAVNVSWSSCVTLALTAMMGTRRPPDASTSASEPSSARIALPQHNHAACESQLAKQPITPRCPRTWSRRYHSCGACSHP